jgi:hypothetical protein
MHTCANCGKTFFHKPDHIFLDGKKRKLCGPGCGMKESIKDMGKATADGVKVVGGAAYSSTVGSGMQVSKEIGAEVANAGVALTGAAIERGGLLGGLGFGVGFFLGPGLNAVIAFIASEFWFLYFGGLIWGWDWTWGIMYFVVTGAGLILATLPALGSMLLIVKILEMSQKTIDSDDQKTVRNEMLKMSGKLIGISLVFDLIWVGIGMIGFDLM